MIILPSSRKFHAISDPLDFSAFDKVDDPGKVSETATVITAALVDRDETFHYTKDYGAGYFTDFVHWVDVNVTAQTDDNGSRLFAWALADAASDLKVIADASGDCILIQLKRQDATHYEVHIVEVDGGVFASLDNSGPIAVNTPSYLAITRSGTTATVEIYSTAALRLAGGDGNVDTITGTIINTAFQYIYGIASYDDNTITGKDISGTISNLIIREPVT